MNRRALTLENALKRIADAEKAANEETVNQRLAEAVVDRMIQNDVGFYLFDDIEGFVFSSTRHEENLH